MAKYYAGRLWYREIKNEVLFVVNIFVLLEFRGVGSWEIQFCRRPAWSNIAACPKPELYWCS